MTVPRSQSGVPARIACVPEVLAPYGLRAALVSNFGCHANAYEEFHACFRFADRTVRTGGAGSLAELAFRAVARRDVVLKCTELSIFKLLQPRVQRIGRCEFRKARYTLTPFSRRALKFPCTVQQNHLRGRRS